MNRVETLEARRLMAAQVTTFTLMNAVADRPIDGYLDVSEGETIDLAKLPTRKVSIRANVDSQPGSVVFGFDGDKTYQVENLAPYVIRGDERGDINSWSLGIGTHTLTGRTYTGSKATGTASTTKSVTFKVIDSAATSGGGGGSTGSGSGSTGGGGSSSSVPQPGPGGETIVVDPAGSIKTIAQAASAAGPGDVILIKPGTYHEQLKLTHDGTTDAPITFAAAELGTVTIDGSGKSWLLEEQGDNVRFKNLVFNHCDNALQTSAMHITGQNVYMTDCVIQNMQAQGLIVNGSGARLLRVTAQYNGQEGIGGGDVSNVVVKDCILRYNNPGLANPDWAGDTHSVKKDGLWYVRAEFEAGGGKWVRSDNLTFDGVQSYSNHGTGLWFDGDNENVTVKNCNLHDAIPIVGFWDGVGLSIEVNKDGPFYIENNTFDNDPGGQIVIASSRNVNVTSNHFSGDYIGLNDWDRGDNYTLRNIKFSQNTFDNTFIWTGGPNFSPSTGDDRNIDFNDNDYDTAANVLFKWGGKDYATISNVRSGLGFESSGSASN